MSDASTNITKPKTSSAERKQVEGPSAKTKSLRSQNAPSSVPWMQCLRLLLRSVGLGIACIIHGFEPRKPLFHKSRRAVLAGSAVHILPAAVSACLLTYNIRGYFIGRELEGANSQDDLKLGALQISAKLQVGGAAYFSHRRGVSGWTTKQGLPTGAPYHSKPGLHHIECHPTPSCA